MATSPPSSPIPSVFLALGSNMDPQNHLRAAAAMLRERWPSIRFSSAYCTAPVGYADQADFLNAVARVETEDEPAAIAAELRTIETALGKAPPFRFGPRTIDLDLLLHGDRRSDDPLLQLPHARMHERRFVLEPLCELIDPSALHPTLGISWSELLQRVTDQHCEKSKEFVLGK